jgi:hypothetical protein
VQSTKHTAMQLSASEGPLSVFCTFGGGGKEDVDVRGSDSLDPDERKRARARSPTHVRKLVKGRG